MIKKTISKLKHVTRDFVFGMEDGLVSNLGLVLGVYIGGGNQFAIILAGLASMLAGAFSMSAGSYLSAKSQREVYEQEIKIAEKAIKNNPQKCLREMRSLLRAEGMGKDELDSLMQNYSQKNHPKFVCNYLVQQRVGISKGKMELPLRNALTMFFSFIVGSLFPIMPFILLIPDRGAILAVILTILALFGVGWAKTVYTKRNWLKSGLEIVFIGVGAGVMGYFVGFVLKMLF